MDLDEVLRALIGAGMDLDELGEADINELYALVADYQDELDEEDAGKNEELATAKILTTPTIIAWDNGNLTFYEIVPGPCVVEPMWPEYKGCRVVCTVDEFEEWLGM